jgi:hypothetical protein
VAPSYSTDAFNCPHCEAYAKQFWNQVTYGERVAGRFVLHDIIQGLMVSHCGRCSKFALWYSGNMIFPKSSSASLPLEDMPVDS